MSEDSPASSLPRTFLILHGWGGSGLEHWQTWLAERLRFRGETVRYPVLPDPDLPKLGPWLEALEAELAAVPAAAERLTVVCHSLAVILWLQFISRRSGVRLAHRVALVAPPADGPEVRPIASFFPAPLDPESVHAAAGETCLICTAADPYCIGGAEAIYGVPLGIPVTVLPDAAAHINTDSGHGPWPLIEEWCLS